MMLVGKADTLLADRARMDAGRQHWPRSIGVVAGAAGAACAPLLTQIAGDLLGPCRAENARLHEQNDRLQRSGNPSRMALDAENQRAEGQACAGSRIPMPSFVTARVVADAGGVYMRRAVLAFDRPEPCGDPQG